MELPGVALEYDDRFPAEMFDPFVTAMRDDDVDVQLHTKDPQAFASIVWFMATLAVVYVGKPYVEAFLKAAGTDHYNVFKKAVGGLAHRLAGPDGPKVQLIGTPGKVPDEIPFSMAYSIMAAGDGEALKFLIPEDLSVDEYETMAGEIAVFLREYHAGELSTEMAEKFSRTRPVSGTRFLTYDTTKKTLEISEPSFGPGGS